MKHDYQAALDRIKRNVMPCDAWTEEDWEHFETVKDALKLAASVVRCKDCKHSAVGFNRTPEGNIVSLFCCKGDTCKIVDAFDFCSNGKRREP